MVRQHLGPLSGIATTRATVRRSPSPPRRWTPGRASVILVPGNPTAIGASSLSEARRRGTSARHIRGVNPIMRLDPHRVPRRHRGHPGLRVRPAAAGTGAGHEATSRAPAPPAATSAPEPGGEVKAVTQAILEEIDKRSELMANIEYLCDMIGPRLTGSPSLTKANHWTRDKFQQYGLANAHLEPWTIERAWTRGEAKGRVVVPVEQRILLESAGWSPSTKGPQRGPVVHVKAQSADELSPYKGKLKGAWVLLAEVSVQPSPKQPAAQPGRRDAAADARLHADAGVPPGAQEVPGRRRGRRHAPSTRTRSTA